MDQSSSLDAYGVENVFEDDLMDVKPCKIEEEIEGSDDWINEVDISEFALKLAPQLRSLTPRNNIETERASTAAYPKPPLSYSCLIALALRNSPLGQLTVADIYIFMCEHFPYFRTAPPGWKNSVRHNLSLNKCFEKIEVESDSQGRKSCLWTIRADKVAKVESDMRKWKERDSAGIAEGMERPEDFASIEDGSRGMPPPLDSALFYAQQQHQQSLPLLPLPSALAMLKDPKAMEAAAAAPFKPQQPPAPPAKVIPAILDRRPHKRTLSTGSEGAPLESVLAARSSATTTRPRTPPQPPLSIRKKARPDLLAMVESSPVHPVWRISEFRAAQDAISDNSLLTDSLNASPLKASTIFPKINMAL